MSSLYADRLRPQFHFTARENWLNDPNGCVYHDGEYHLFFQHNPHGREWGNMTWGHAVSPDLVHWTQLDDAIRPYDGGTIFSGSAVVDAHNTSGLGRDGIAPLVAIFTHARDPFGQALAFSLDRGRTWTLYDGGRHVVPNQGLDPGERDPKVFWHEPTARWVMVLWVRAGQARFFTSPNLTQWTHAPPECDFFGEGFYECPDLFPLRVDGDPNHVRWVLHDAAFNYWIGAFDGTRFTPEIGPLRGDFGPNFYAAQTWNHTGHRVYQIAWMRGGQYPGMPFNQQMTFPCELTLRTTPAGPRLYRTPVDAIEKLYAGCETIRDRALSPDEEIQFGPAGDCFDLKMEVELPEDAVLTLLVHGVEVRVSREKLACGGCEAPLNLAGAVVKLRVLVDRTSIEVFGDEGSVSISLCFAPTKMKTPIFCYPGRATLAITRIQMHPLQSAWWKRCN